MTKRSSLGLLPLLAAMIVAVVFACSGSPIDAAPSQVTVATGPSGMSEMPGGGPIPSALLPPGADSPDEGPSPAIFPPQQAGLRFNHSKHVKMEVACTTCHDKVTTSDSAKDSLLPAPTTCDGCHGTDHRDLNRVQPGTETRGACGFCHIGYNPADGNRVAAMAIPRPNLNFTHRKHLAANMSCVQCHGDVGSLELATRSEMPRMAGCFKCHQGSEGSGAHTAKSACVTCHLRENGEGPIHEQAESGGTSGGRMRTLFASGELKPPQWLHDAEHTPDWIQRHKEVAAADSSFCANCHTENYCTDCHDGRVRPRNIHPADYISMHPIEARMATQKCTSCHQEQSFCLNCHMRLGISMSGPPGVRESGRFHPQKSIWSDAPVQPGHHMFEAERNLNACVSCHTERDCVTCHGGAGIGAGFNPHPAGFMSRCQTQFRRNPRPCMVCHEPGEASLSECR